MHAKEIHSFLLLVGIQIIDRCIIAAVFALELSVNSMIDHSLVLVLLPDERLLDDERRFRVGMIDEQFEPCLDLTAVGARQTPFVDLPHSRSLFLKTEIG